MLHKGSGEVFSWREGGDSTMTTPKEKLLKRIIAERDRWVKAKDAYKKDPDNWTAYDRCLGFVQAFNLCIEWVEEAFKEDG